MKKVYFIRHGESEGNVANIRQGAAVPLTANGRAQAGFVADRCSRLPIEMIISSTMKRGMETAEIISQRIEKPTKHSDLFNERRVPGDQLGLSRADPRALEIDRIIERDFSITGFRYSDEENFEDLNDRAKNALGYLEALSEKNILVVTHGFFMSIILARAIFGEDLTGKECAQFIKKCHMENTGITVLGFDKRKENPWWLWVWNDHAHLG